MQLHELRPKHKLKKRKRVGRGGKRGTYSGRGQKGQKSRSGRRLQPVVRELIKRYPKLRGYRMKSRFPISNFQTIVNLDVLEKKFDSGDKVNPKVLLEKKIIDRIKGRLPQVKILGQGELKKTLTLENLLISKQAKDKIKKAGGKII